MSKRKILFLLVLFMTLSTLALKVDVHAAASDLQILFNNTGNTITSCNNINANFKLTNNSSSNINLADLKFRYYYTADSDKEQNFFCDHAGMLNGWTYSGVTDKVTGTFHKISPATKNADSYVEIGFKSDAGMLSAGGYIEIQTRVARSDWTNYDLSNDYSFKVSKDYTENNKITAYLKGNLIYGNECVVIPPIISPTSITYDISSDSDVLVTLTPNGNSFKGIVGLTQDKDYTITENTITILKEYLSSLPCGDAKLVFDYGVENNPVLNISVSSIARIPTTIEIGSGTGTTFYRNVTVPITLSNINTVGEIGAFNFYVEYDTTRLQVLSIVPGDIIVNPDKNASFKLRNDRIEFNYIDTTWGNEPITKDGIVANITFGIIANTKSTLPLVVREGGDYFVDGEFSEIEDIQYINGCVMLDKTTSLDVKVADVTGNVGDIVSVPISFSNVAKMEDVRSCKFNVNYDANLLEAISVEPGPIATNAEANFIADITTSGAIGISYNDSKENSDLISEDGIFANIKFRLKTPSADKAKTPVEINQFVAYCNSLSDSRRFPVSDILDAGSVTIMKTIMAEPILSPSKTSFIIEGIGQIKINLIPNLNKFIGITGLKSGTDYLVSEDTVTLLYNYINSLSIGTHKLIFDFGLGDKNPVLELEAKIGTPDLTLDYNLVYRNELKNIKITLFPHGNHFNGIVGLTEGTDYTVYDDEVIILKEYL